VNDLGFAFKEAIRLILSADAEVTTIVFASLRFSLSSTVLASLIGIPRGHRAGIFAIPLQKAC
jgi:ABC-type tungstate transport system substrate-binding protein